MVNLVTPKQHLLMPVLYGSKYWKKVLNVDQANLIAYWPMGEASGTTAVDKSAESNDGTYSGVTLGQTGIGDGMTCPLWDGANDYMSAYSAGFIADFDGAEGTIALWVKVSAAGVWTDSTTRQFYNFFVDAANYIRFGRSTTNNRLLHIYRAGGTTTTTNINSQSDTGWVHWAQTWSATADQEKAYKNGVQEGATKTGLGTWAGTLAANNAVLGALSKTPTQVWSGTEAHCAIWKTPLAASKIAKLASV